MSEERMRILKMIEEGIVSAEEGAKLLSAIEEEGPAADAKTTRKYGVKEFIGEAYEKIKNVDFDLSFGEAFTFEHVKEIQADDFNDIDVSIVNGALDVETWDQDFAKAEFRVKVYQAKDEEEARERFFADSQFDSNHNVLRLSSPSKRMKTIVRLFVPNRRYEFIKSKLSNGSIHAYGLESDHWESKSSNGSIRLNDMSGETCKMETVNGSIQVVNGSYNKCEADTVNGSIKLEGDFTKNHASAVTGSVVVENNGSHTETGFFKTTTGSIIVHLPKEQRIDGNLKTRFGSIDCRLENYKIIQNKKEVISKQLEFEALEEYPHAYHVEAETKTGSVTLIPAKEI
ncbi:DUF4097 family beta strand repeat-containing protein [Halobacillus rhizosphaerae]|uniref:DUF4097 family beta strand repeat-containing protein n=1 Tax=Halobacillus rhizosphaerae TaxID=3064889 RepID=UPI00398A6C5A